MDIFGVNILAILTACGGGLLRDIVMGKFPPSMFVNPFYVAVAVVVANIVFLIMYFHKGIPEKFSNILESIKIIGFKFFEEIKLFLILINKLKIFRRGITFIYLFATVLIQITLNKPIKKLWAMFDSFKKSYLRN